MKYNRKKLAGFILLFSIVLISNSSNPPNGRTGAPGETTCNQCHSGNNPSLDGDIVMSGLPATIMAGNTYNITVTVDNPNGNASRAGFQWTVLDGANTAAGTISNASASSTISLFNGRSYHEHAPAVTFPASNVVTWTADWTAPAGPNGDNITIYAIANIANGSGSSNDRIRLTQASGTLMAPVLPLMASITASTDALCFLGTDGTATVTATEGTPPYSYLWDNGETTQTAIMLDAGMHTVTVTDSAGDMATATVTIGQPTFLNGFIDAQTDATCGMANGTATASATGGTPGYTYQWSDGQTGPIAVNLAVGQYFVTVTDMNMCMTMFGVFINDIGSQVIVNTISLDDISCNGANDGQIEVEGINGMPPYTYAWMSGQTTALIDNLGPGSYTVTVTDAGGCTNSATLAISEPNPLELDMSDTQNPTCNGDSDGFIAPVVNGGLGVISYLWSDGTTNDSLLNLDGGWFYLTITDENMCMTSDSAEIIHPAPIAITMSSTPLSGPGADDGTATANPSGGTPPFGYLWDNGEKTMTITDLPPGTYGVTVSDDNDCTAMSSITINPFNCNVGLIGMIEHVSCFGENTGSITAMMTNATDPINYVWDIGLTTDSIGDLTAGIYMVTATDAIGCMAMQSFEVVQGDSLELSEDIIALPQCENSMDGFLSLFVQGGVPPYTYAWNNGETNDTLFNAMPGMYTCIVTDFLNCQREIEIDLNYADTEPPISDIMDTVELYIEVSGMTPLLTLADFDLGSSDNCGLESIIFADSSYTCTDLNTEIKLAIELQDTTGNITMDTFDVVVIDTFPPEIFCIDDMTITSCESVSFDDPLHFDNCSSTISQIAGPVSGSIFNPGDNVITFQAVDESGNTAECSFTISVEVDLMTQVTSNDVSCFGFSDGSASISITGGTAPYIIEPILNLDFLAAGEYPFTVTDDEGCVVNDTIFINQPEVLLIADFDITDATNSNSNDGAIEITPSGGTGSYLFEWFLNGVIVSTDEDPENLAPGTYTCVVTDESGCTYESIDFVVDSVVASEDISFENDVRVYPNPASNFVKIDFDNSNHLISELSLMDMKGTMIMRKVINDRSAQIDVSNYPSGIHLMRIVIDDNVIIKKVIIQ